MSAWKRIFALSVVSMLAITSQAFGLERLSNGYFHTGDGVRQKKVLLATFDVYSIGHEMKELPPAKSKQAVVDMDVGKRIIWQMRRDVDAEKIRDALSEAYAKNGYTDRRKIDAFVGVFRTELKDKQIVTITYDAEKKTTTLQVHGGGNATVPGVDFMKATWNIWFGKIDQPSLGDALISRL